MDMQEFQDMLGRAKAGFKDRYGEGREDYRRHIMLRVRCKG